MYLKDRTNQLMMLRGDDASEQRCRCPRPISDWLGGLGEVSRYRTGGRHGTDARSRQGLRTLSWAGYVTRSPPHPEHSGPVPQGDSKGCPASRHPSQTDGSKASGGRHPAKGRAPTSTSAFQGPAHVAWPSPHTSACSAKWGPSWKGLEAEPIGPGWVCFSACQ